MARAGQPAHKLKDHHRTFIVQRLACYDTPTEARNALIEEFGIEITLQSVEHYDPHKGAGRALATKWRQLFDETRKSFLKHVELHVAEANKAVRVHQLGQAAKQFRRKGNYLAMADMFEKIAKELGNVHTNKREFTGKDGGPIQFSELTEDQIDHRLATLLGTADSVVDGSDNPPTETDRPTTH